MKKTKYADNVFVGSPLHDIMVCEITPEFLKAEFPEINELLTVEIKETFIDLREAHYQCYDIKEETWTSEYWNYLKNRTLPPGLYHEQHWKGIQDAFDKICLMPLEKPRIDITLETPIVNEGSSGFKNIVGYWDVIAYVEIPHIENAYFDTYWKGQKGKKSIRKYIEVKPKIESLGALLRQLNLYKQYMHFEKSDIYVYTSDLKFKNQLESQNIKIIERKNSETPSLFPIS